MFVARLSCMETLNSISVFNLLKGDKACISLQLDLNRLGFTVGSVTAKDVDTGDTLTLSLDSVGKELFDIVDSGGAIDYSGSSPLKRYLRLKKALDREVSWYNFKHSTGCLFFFEKGKLFLLVEEQL